MIKRLKAEIKQTLLSNIKGYILIFCVFFAGVAFSYILNVSSGAESEIKLYINDFISAVKNYSSDSYATFSGALEGYIKGICILFFMSLTVVGSLGTLVYVFVKGFSYGIVIISMFSIMESNAILLFLCLILPHSLVLIPCFSSYSIYCMKNAYSLLKGVKNIKLRIIMPLVYGCVCLGFLSVSALIQAYVEPLMIRAII